MSMPLGAFAYSGASLQPDRPRQPKPPKTPNTPRSGHLSRSESSLSRRFLLSFGRRSGSKQQVGRDSQKPRVTTSVLSSAPLARPKHIPIIIPYLREISPLNPTNAADPTYSVSKQSFESEWSQSDFGHFPHTIQRPFNAVPLIQPRHVEITIPNFPRPSFLTPTAKHPVFDNDSSTTTPSCPDTTITPGMSISAASSRASTLDSATSVPSPSELHARQGSSAQISVNSSQLSLGGSASEQESSQGDQGSSTQQSRSSVAQSTPTQTSNLSGLVCNVHRTTGKEPPALVGASTTILGDKLYVFGGRRISRSKPHLTFDLYELDLLTRNWVRLDVKGDVPSPRYFHSVCALGDHKLVCYGGMSPEADTVESNSTPGVEPQVIVMSDIHFFDVPTRTWMEITTAKSPQGRYAHCASILPSSAVFTSSDAPISAIHNNPSGTDPNQGSIGVQIDGTGGAEMIVVGGQDSMNRYIEQISVFNLRSLTWTSTLPMLGKSCGAYRSVVTPLTTMSVANIGAGPGRLDEEDDDGDEVDAHLSGSPMLVYTNYNFLDVKLELQIRLTDGTLVDKAMSGTATPPGLRFPSGGIIDNHFVVGGTFLTSSKQEFSLWALDLRNLTWARIDTGSTVFSQGSWNKGVLWSRRNAFCILGDRKRNLIDDYNNRRINFTNICVVQLEAFGLYDNPRRTAPTSNFISGSAPLTQAYSSEASIGGRQMSAAAELLGEMSLEARELCDMDFLAIDGSRIPVNSRLVARRWGPTFNTLLRECASESNDTATLRPSNASTGTSKSAVTMTPSISSSNATTLTANTGSSAGGAADPRLMPPNLRPRILYLPHTAPTLKAFTHFLYTSSLPPASSPYATPLVLCSLLQIARPYKIDGLLEAIIERLHEALDSRNAGVMFNAAAMAAGGGDDIRFAPENQRNLAVPSRPALPIRTASLGPGVESKLLAASLAGNNTSNGDHGVAAVRSSVVNPLRIDTDVANDGVRSAGTTRNTVRNATGSRSATINEDDGDNDHGSITSSNSQHFEFSPAADDPLSAGTATAATPGEKQSRGGGESDNSNGEIWDGGWSAVIGLQKRGLRGLMEGRRAMRKGTSSGSGLMSSVAPSGGSGSGGSGSGSGSGAGVGLGIV